MNRFFWDMAVWFAGGVELEGECGGDLGGRGVEWC